MKNVEYAGPNFLSVVKTELWHYQADADKDLKLAFDKIMLKENFFAGFHN